ncbi:hypothetical protein AWJ20_579 [Sugiyamaella lignohabitans]|uniref:DUF914-domain-containing protein n=1 Tax=Sugiyamaella lignohabitans TaxID=796027 RepID=A0A167D0H5_9ASCO|nr:uncharacterized protein AWJ20_579 [Sugiyamaella lignohabitans]ANB12329.1 hypothetical protein AWJ20_579 [Sugiyamaella lignohabitans]
MESILSMDQSNYKTMDETSKDPSSPTYDVEDLTPVGSESQSVAPTGTRRLLRPFQFLLTPHFWIIFIHGQILSMSIVSTNTLSSFLANGGNSIPAFQTLFNYVILALIFIPFCMYKYGIRKWFTTLWKDSWKYFIFAFADVEGNYFVVKAYAYTNILSAALLDNFAIVVVIILSFCLLKVRYHWTQLLGVVVCIGGMALLVVSDFITDKDYPAVNMVKGDLFVLLGAAFYGVSNTAQEYFVSKRPVYEVLGFLGFWAVIINGVQVAIFERTSIQEAAWSGPVAGYFVGYTLSLLLLYMTCPILLRMSSAAFYNLSLLTSDFWSLLIGIRVFGYYVYWLYPVGFVFTVLGMIIYYAAPQTALGEAIKPWLGENQSKGIVGLGTARKHVDGEIEEPSDL